MTCKREGKRVGGQEGGRASGWEGKWVGGLEGTGVDAGEEGREMERSMRVRLHTFMSSAYGRSCMTSEWVTRLPIAQGAALFKQREERAG